MEIGVLKESKQQEKRVAITPKIVSKIKKLGHTVRVEKGLGLDANFYDSQYIEAGAEVADANRVWTSDMILKIYKPYLSSSGVRGYKYFDSILFSLAIL